MKKNMVYAHEIADIAGYIAPDEVQLNTPLRPCGVEPLTKDELTFIEKHFNSLNVISVYKSRKKDVEPISSENTLKRRGKSL